jgi:hypothetical protein
MSEFQHGIGAGDSQRVKIFNGKDFHLWKFQFLIQATIKDIVGFLDGSASMPNEGSSMEDM